MESASVPRASTHRRRQRETEFARLVAFSDGVLAIAVTLLVLNLEIPADALNLGEAMRGKETEFFAYALSFAVIGRFWIAHHTFFAILEGYDRRLMSLNLLYLALIVLIPFSTEAFGEFNGHADAVALYATNMALVAVVSWLMVAHALRAGLMKDEEREAAALSSGPGSLVVPLVFLLSIPFAMFISADWAPAIWSLLFFIHPETRRRVRDRRRARSSAPRA